MCDFFPMPSILELIFTYFSALFGALRAPPWKNSACFQALIHNIPGFMPIRLCNGPHPCPEGAHNAALFSLEEVSCSSLPIQYHCQFSSHFLGEYFFGATQAPDASFMTCKTPTPPGMYFFTNSFAHLIFFWFLQHEKKIQLGKAFFCSVSFSQCIYLSSVGFHLQPILRFPKSTHSPLLISSNPHVPFIFRCCLLYLLYFFGVKWANRYPLSLRHGVREVRIVPVFHIVSMWSDQLFFANSPS